MRSTRSLQPQNNPTSVLIRAFIAIEIPKNIKKQIISHTAELRQKVGRNVRWVADENIHLTLIFLGEISPVKINSLSQILSAETRKQPSFEITVDGLGAFPNLRRPRIIWIGLNAPDALVELQKTLEKAAIPLGYVPDKRTFSPHLTIARICEGISGEETLALQHVLESTQVSSPGKFTVESIHLMQSELKPAGPVYTRLSTAILGG